MRHMPSPLRTSRRADGSFTHWTLIGMVHLPPLPGAARSVRPLSDILKRAVVEARLLARAGFDAMIVENFGDAPFAPDAVSRETIAAMAIVVDHIARAVRIPVGVNVLRNDALSALAVAATAGAAFIRVNVLSGTSATDQGLITGRAHELLRRRSQVAPRVRIAADVHVKHATPVSQPDIAIAAEETAYRAGADALIVSGTGTGKPTDLDAARRVAEAVPGHPLWIGSGVSAATVRDCLEVATGVIVGTSLKRGGKTEGPIDPARVRRFIKAARTR
ncbi:MAG: BtpA/SgcQ family protein [Phycisphaerae bacterium]